MKTGVGMSFGDRDFANFYHYPGSSEDDDDSTTRSGSPDHISYRSRPEWSDVEPISIKTQTSIMNIEYTPRYEEAFSYFRAMLVRDELSERSLALTEDCIDLQRSNFSVWYFRRRILKKLTHHLDNELAFIERIIKDEPKNYQVWHHRKTIVEWLRDASQDKKLTMHVISYDNKNYHAWQHRQWLIKEFNLWEGELEFTLQFIEFDQKNNSAWNHRFYVVKETKRYEDPKWLEEEFGMIKSFIQESPHNESSWSYLRGILTLAFKSLVAHQGVRDFVDQMYAEKGCSSPHLYAFMLDMIHEELTKSTKLARTQIDKNALKSKAEELCQELSKRDFLRSRYWNYIGLKMKDL